MTLIEALHTKRSEWWAWYSAVHVPVRTIRSAEAFAWSYNCRDIQVHIIPWLQQVLATRYQEVTYRVQLCTLRMTTESCSLYGMCSAEQLVWPTPSPHVWIAPYYNPFTVSHASILSHMWQQNSSKLFKLLTQVIRHCCIVPNNYALGHIQHADIYCTTEWQ